MTVELLSGEPDLAAVASLDGRGAAHGAVSLGARPRLRAALGRLRASALGGAAPRRLLSAPRAAIAATVLPGAAVVGYLTAQNPAAQPPDVAIEARLTIILVLLGTGMFAGATRLHARIGSGLLAAAPFACLWLLNGAAAPLAFTVGSLFTVASPAVYCYLMLAHPTGRLRASAERRLLVGCTAAMAAAWTLLMLGGENPPLTTPLLRCAPHCPRDVLAIGGLPATEALKGVAVAAWIGLAAGTLVLLLRRLARANAPVRRVMLPVVVAGVANVVLLLGFQLARVLDSDAAPSIGTAYVAVAIAVPFALLAGLLLERLFMGRALAEFLDRLASSSSPDVEALLARELHDPSLSIAYSAAAGGGYVDAGGSSVEVPPRDPGRSVVAIDRGRAPVAAVLYDSQLAEQERYIQAAGEAAMLWLESSRLAAEHAATSRELAVSRRRLLDAAVEERARIQRDLHDGAQQRLIGMRAKAEAALRADDPAAGTRALREISGELGEALEEVRTLADGVFPPLLTEYGLGSALKSAGRRCGADVDVVVEADGRFPRDLEGAIYFACLEAIQNLAKHAGADARGSVRLWRDGDTLRFEVRDRGVGFASASVRRGRGTINMQDRVAAVGGVLRIDATPGAGVVVAGAIPLASCPEPRADLMDAAAGATRGRDA